MAAFTGSADERTLPWRLEPSAVTLRRMGMTKVAEMRLAAAAVLLCLLGACTAETSGSGAGATAPSSTVTPTEATLAQGEDPEPADDADPDHSEGTASAKVLVLRPNGVGPLRLGMSHRDVLATGFASARLGSRHDGWPSGCRILQYRSQESGRIGGSLSAGHGLESIVATPRMVTPEGIRLGSSLDAVRRTYEPDAVRGSFITVEASVKSVYRIQVGPNAIVNHIALEMRRPNCVR